MPILEDLPPARRRGFKLRERASAMVIIQLSGAVYVTLVCLRFCATRSSIAILVFVKQCGVSECTFKVSAVAVLCGCVAVWL